MVRIQLKRLRLQQIINMGFDNYCATLWGFACTAESCVIVVVYGVPLSTAGVLEYILFKTGFLKPNGNGVFEQTESC